MLGRLLREPRVDCVLKNLGPRVVGGRQPELQNDVAGHDPAIENPPRFALNRVPIDRPWLGEGVDEDFPAGPGNGGGLAAPGGGQPAPDHRAKLGCV